MADGSESQPKEPGLKLLSQHAELISQSGISQEVAAVRGYRSVTKKADLVRLGFSESQARVPALLIPVWNVRGELALYQARPDEPRVVKGRVIKYETPAGSRMVLDVPPPAREWLRDPKRPLFITEGVRKADAAVSVGLCCIDVLGVWNWRGTNDAGGKVALADWEVVALNNRTVFIVFDSDVVQKREVKMAMDRLKVFLKSRGATVHIVHLPTGPLGEKVGLDDYLAAGRPIELLFGLNVTQPEVTDSCPDDLEAESPYAVDRGRLCYVKQTREGAVLVPLCNFDASITEEVSIDDGCETSRAFMVEGRLSSGKPLPSIRVAADKFARMDWVVNGWGLEAVVSAGMASRDRLREAIQLRSPDARKRRIFTHTGWRQFDEKWIYLTSGGAVGEDGFNVELGDGLSRYNLPRDPHDAVGAMRASLDLLRVGPPVVTFPLWAAVFRAPLASVLALDLAIWIEGITGSLKSTLAALFLAHYGAFDRTNLPGNWSSTANALEKHAFMLKDAVYAIDDYAPTAVDRKELETKAARLLRAQGNLAGRSRLRADLTERPGYAPRGLVLGTGEARPTGRSILARTFMLELDRKVIDFDKLSVSQGTANLLPHALSGYIQWLAPQMSTMPAALTVAFAEARAKASTGSAHLRIPEALAHLWVGLDCGLSYASEIGACTRERAIELRQQGWKAFVDRAGTQSVLQDEERPVKVFLQVLSTLVVQKRVLLLQREHAIEREARDCPAIGWFDTDYIYLVPEAAFQAVSRFMREGGDVFPVSERTLRSDLVREEVAVGDKDRNTTSARVGGTVQRVLKLRRAVVEVILGVSFPIVLPVVTAVTGSRE